MSDLPDTPEAAERQPLLRSRFPRQVGNDTVALYCDECGESTHWPDRCPRETPDEGSTG